MNREQALQRAIELKEHSQEFESVSFIDDDTEFFEYVIKELERTAPEVPVQEQSNNMCYISVDELAESLSLAVRTSTKEF
ncbi:MAG: hypothetical protein E6342_00440 [Clostridium sp.]|uniref:hypothetical protein n=2 Tax=Clostridium sp. TaxID=1506 RepID=UPI0029095832|nr:hypothetical protein [Clostridium sp.]MDU7086160.1 hypothetical protein [Clostridium sp.]